MKSNIFKISDGKLCDKKAYCEESAEVIVGVSPTPKDLMFI